MTDTCSCLTLSAWLKADIAGHRPEPCKVHDEPLPEMPGPVGLNSDAIVDALARAVGANTKMKESL